MSTSEIAWTHSGFLRHRRLLHIGNERWDGEQHRGYPCRTVASNKYNFVVAYGETPAARRRSRVELWNMRGQITCAQADPTMDGKILWACATSASAAAPFGAGGITSTWGGAETTLEAFAEALEDNPQVRNETIRRFVEGWPHGQNAAEAIVAKGGGGGSGEGVLQHGICLRLRIPYTMSTIVSLQLNGESVLEGPNSEVDGWTSWKARGFHFVQLNIPPAKSKECDFYLITCEYEPGEKRQNWRGWLND